MATSTAPPADQDVERFGGEPPDLGFDAHEERRLSSVDARCFRLLSQGRIHALRREADQVDPSDRSVLLRLLLADADLQANVLELASLDELEVEAASQDPQLHALLCSCRAWHLLWRGDPLCLEPADRGLLLLPEDRLLTPVGLFARARLHLARAAGTLFCGFDQITPAMRSLDLAVTDFHRAGLVEQGATAVAYVVTIAAASTYSNLRESADTVAASARRLESRESPMAPVARIGEALLRFLAGDLWTFWRIVEGVERDASSPVVLALAAYLRMAVDVIAGNVSPDFSDRAEQLLGVLERAAPELAGSITRTISNLLLDVNRPELARVWAAWSDATPPALPTDKQSLGLARARLMIHDGDLDGGQALARECVVANERAGLRRSGAMSACQVARTLAAAGHHDLAARWRAGAAPVLRPPATIWEAILLGPELFAAPETKPANAAATTDTATPTAPDRVSTSASVPVTIRALAPTMLLRTPAGELRFGQLPARIVAVLLSHQRLVTTEELIDAIWPATDPDAARHRLDTALYRMRKWAPVDSIVVRERDGLRLGTAEEGVESDVATFLAALPSDLDAATHAIQLYEDDFVARQLAYDESTFETRRWLRARYITLASAVFERHCEQGTAGDIVDLALAARDAASEDPALADLIVGVLEASGRDAEAATVRTEIVG